MDTLPLKTQLALLSIPSLERGKKLIQSRKAQLTELEAHQYSVTQKQIDQFRTLVSDKLVVCQQSVLYSTDKNASNELNKVLMQYLSGATTQEQFIQEMEKRTRMMELEAK